MVVDPVGNAESTDEIIVGVVGIDACGRERGEFGIRTPLRTRIDEPNPSGPMASVERVGTEYARSAARTEAACTEVVGCGGSGKSNADKQESARDARIYGRLNGSGPSKMARERTA